MALLRRLPTAKIALWLALASAFPALVSCAGVPYLDTRREAGQKAPVGPSTPDMVAICAFDGGAAQAEVLKLAESECAKTARVPKFDHEDRWACTMVAPRRFFYRCVPKS